jgi:hypothetical protein
MIAKEFGEPKGSADSPMLKRVQKVPILDIPLKSPDERDRKSDRSENRMCIFASLDEISGMLDIGKDLPGNEHREAETGTVDRDAFKQLIKRPGGLRVKSK